MPELPEVETIRRQLETKIVGKKLSGKPIKRVRRAGKILLIDFADKSSLAFHLKLTGQLLLNAKPSQHTRKVFNFDDGTKLIFNNMRKFGWWKKVKSSKDIEAKLGPDALALNLKTFLSLIKKRPKSKIKPLLMDQKFIAGIGNIYADEILFASKIQPTRLAYTLTEQEIKVLLQSVKRILKAAIKSGGSSVKDYVDIEGKTGKYKKCHKVYRKAGQKCPRCGAIIKRLKLGGRSAHFCSKCQK